MASKADSASWGCHQTNCSPVFVNLPIHFVEITFVNPGKRSGREDAIDIFHLEAIERVFGDHLQFICVHRHPLDVVVSVKEWCDKCEAYPPELHSYVARYPKPLEAFARAWVDRTEKLVDFSSRRPDRVVSVQYEELVHKPEQQLCRLLEFLEIETEPGIVESAFEKIPDGFGDWKAYGSKEPKQDGIGRWRKLPTTTIQELGAIVNPMLELLGYKTIPTSAKITPEEARRRYHLGLRLQQK